MSKKSSAADPQADPVTEVVTAPRERAVAGPAPRRRRRRVVWVALATMAAVLAVGLVWLSDDRNQMRARAWLGMVEVAAPDMSQTDTGTAGLIEKARQAVLADPASSETWLNYGMTLDAANIQDFAVPAYQEAARLDPVAIAPRYHLAILYHATGALDDAIALYREIAAQEPDYPPLHVRLGDVLAAAGRTDEARDAYDRAIALAPDYPAAHRGLGQALLTLSDRAGAIEHLERTLELERGQADRATFAALAQAYRLDGRTEEANEMARKAEQAKTVLSSRDSLRLPVVRLRPDVRMARVRAELLLKTGNFDKALEPLQTVLAAWPDDPNVLLTMSQVYEKVGQPAQAAAFKARAEALYLRGQPDAAPPAGVP